MPYVPTRTDGSVMDPRESHFSELCAAVATQNEIVAELIAGLQRDVLPDAAWSDIAIAALRNHSWALGFEFHGQRPTAEWLEERERL